MTDKIYLEHKSLRRISVKVAKGLLGGMILGTLAASAEAALIVGFPNGERELTVDNVSLSYDPIQNPSFHAESTPGSAFSYTGGSVSISQGSYFLDVDIDTSGVIQSIGSVFVTGTIGGVTQDLLVGQVDPNHFGYQVSAVGEAVFQFIVSITSGALDFLPGELAYITLDVPVITDGNGLPPTIPDNPFLSAFSGAGAVAHNDNTIPEPSIQALLALGLPLMVFRKHR